MSLPTADEYLPGHGDPSWAALRYELDLDYVLDGNRLSATAVIHGQALVPGERIVLDLARLRVSKLSIDGKPPAKWAHRENRLVLTTATALAAGQRFTLRIKYSGRPRPLSAPPHDDAGWEELADGVIVAGQPHGAPTWFPCNDHPGDKASYQIAVTAPSDYTVVCNGVLRQRIRRGSSEKWVYEQDEPMACYLATVQIGRYDLIALEPPPADAVPASSTVPTANTVPTSNTVPITLAVPPLADWRPAFGRQSAMMAAFTEFFGPYPFAGYTSVITDDELEIPLESQALATFGRNHLDPAWPVNRLVAHELAHQWFGNAVTARRWRDIWLHEGFACYAEWLWSQAAGLRSADEHAARHHERLSKLPQDLLLADPGPGLMFDDRVYKRGALLLHALRRRIGDAVFFALLREWVRRYRGASVSTADFEALAAEYAAQSPGQITGQSPAQAADLPGFFDAWLRHRRLPPLS